MNSFSIKNLEQYQHYTDRKPIWIKLYCSIISDPGFVSLSEHGKLAYLLLLPLASQQNNKLPEDVTLITKLLHLDSPVDLQELRNKGFIVDYRVIATSHKVPQESLSIYLGVSNLIIGFLNDKAGKNFRETNGNREMIIARLKEGYLNSPMPSRCTERKQDKFKAGGLQSTRNTIEDFVKGDGEGRKLIAFKANTGG